MCKITVAAILALVSIAVFGCSIHFKGTDVELDAMANHTYELSEVDIFGRQIIKF